MIKSFVRILSSNLIVAATKFVMLMLIIRIGSSYEVGIYTYSLAIVSPLFLLSSLRIKSLIVSEGNSFSNKEYIFSVLIFSIFAVLLSLTIVSFLSEPNVIVLSTAFLALQKLFENLKYFFHGYFTKQSQFNYLTMSQNLSYTISLVIFGIYYYLSRSFIESIFVYSFIFILTVTIEIYFFKKIDNFNNQPILINNIYKIIIIGIPLSFSSLINSVTTQFPRFILKHNANLETLGIFSSLSYLLVLVNLIATSISQVFMPKLKFYAEKNLDKFNKLLKNLCITGFLLGFLFMAIIVVYGRSILYFALGSEYADYKNILLILSVNLMFLLSVIYIGTALIALQIYKYHIKIYLVNFIVVIIMSILLIPKYSLLGASISLTIGSVTTFLMYIYIYIKVIRKFINRGD